MKKRPTYELTDHACRTCGGRILLQVTQIGVTGGGNPFYECADCGKRVCDMMPDSICWCGFSQRRQYASGDFVCMRTDAAKEQPWVKDAFAHCGVDVDSGAQIAMVSREMLKVCEQRYWDAQDRKKLQQKP